MLQKNFSQKKIKIEREKNLPANKVSLRDREILEIESVRD